MYSCVAGFLTGIMVLQCCKTLPTFKWLIISSMLGWLVYWLDTSRRKHLFSFILCVLLGGTYSVLLAQHILQWSVPGVLENKTVTVTGMIAALPHSENGQTDFEFNLQTLAGKVQHTKLRLSWYHYPPNVLLTVGSIWQFNVRLKKPHGLSNPGGFDYEKWLFSHGIRATGYIISGKLQSTSIHFSLRTLNERLRQNLQFKIQHTLVNEASAGLIIALIMGAQNGITEQQWQVMRATGTNHLMAIAGVHIGFVAGFFYLGINFLWRRSTRCMLWMPAPLAAVGSSLGAALGYSALAGFALPTQRALIMLSVFTLGVFLRRQLSVWNAFALALLIVLITDPFATLRVSFWLSFSAVFAILYGINGRVKPRGLWWKYARVQWVITLGLIPVSLVLFQQTSWISFIANMFAVPAVGILVLPPSLLGALLLYIWQPAAYWLLLIAAKIITVIWWLLAQLAHWPGAIWQQSFANVWIFIVTLVGVLLILAPKGFPLRWSGILWLLPILYYRVPTPARGEVWLTLLDVGQGLSAVIRTQHHTLVYDTGPKMGVLDDAGSRVVLPFLHSLGIKQLDMLMVSHGDSDHIGGAFSLLAQMPVTAVITSVPERFKAGVAQLCQQGQAWHWDGISFQVLYPPLDLLHQDNNSSCVLSIRRGQHQMVLLTGDIEKLAEDYLLEHNLITLPTTVLVVPHHGSITSSSLGFVRAVGARYALFPVGYENRYHFPSQIVWERYRNLGAVLLDTANAGAISLQINQNAEVIRVQTHRQEKHMAVLE